MKKISLILTFLLTALICFGQKEHLVFPTKGFPDDSVRYRIPNYSKLRAFSDSVNKLLNSGFSEKPYAKYTCMPSFSERYAFSVEKINGKNYILSNKLSENYTLAASPESVVEKVPSRKETTCCEERLHAAKKDNRLKDNE